MEILRGQLPTKSRIELQSNPWKSIKNSWIGREFWSFDILYCLRGVQVVWKSPHLVKWRRGVWLWLIDSYIKQISWQTFESHLKWCPRDKEFIFITVFRQSQTPTLHSTKIEGSDTAWAFVKHYKMLKVGQLSLPNHGYLRDFENDSIVTGFSYQPNELVDAF